jgi:hypothetical protein
VHGRFQLDIIRTLDPIAVPLDTRVSMLVVSTPGRDGHSGAVW